MPAGAAGPERRRGGEPARDLLHRLAERVQHRAPATGRDAAGAGRLQRHRRHRDPAGQGAGRDASSSPRAATTSAPPAWRSAPTMPSTTARRTSSPRRSASPRGRGVDVVLDMVAGDYVGREIECLAEDGRLVIIAVQGGTAAQIDAGLVLRKRLTITGSTLRPRSVAYKAALARELRERVWPLVEAGRVKPVIHQVFPAAEAAQAHALMESSTARRQDRADLVSRRRRPMQRKLVVGNWKMHGSRPANAELLAGTAGRAALSAPTWRCACPSSTSRNGGHAGRQRPALGRAGRLGARAGRLHRRGVGGDAGRVRLPLRHRRPLRAPRLPRRERRSWWRDKAQAALARGVTPIVCVGETLAEREAGQTEEVVKRQLSAVIHQLAHCAAEMVVAYEPVWAIGTGRTATPEQAQAVHARAARAAAGGHRARRRHEDPLRRQRQARQRRRRCSRSPTSTAASSAAPR